MMMMMERTTTVRLFLLAMYLCFLWRRSNVCMCCVEEERQCLLTFKHRTSPLNDDGCNPLSDWKGEDCCSWSGIGCSNTTTTSSGHVIKLSITAPTLNYSCPISSRHIDPCLSTFKFLQHLDLSGMYFRNTTHIPQFIGSSLISLQYLDLSCISNFVGTIPFNFRNLTSLKYLSLSGQYSLHCNNLEWVYHLSSLQYLDLSFVNLTDAVDWPLAIYKLPALSHLYLLECGLSLSLPDYAFAHLTNISALAFLDLSGNYFPDPTKFDRLLLNISKSLVHFGASECYLSGSVPKSLEQLKNLQSLDLNSNSLTGPIPESLGQLKNLQSLVLYFNSLSGPIPESLGQLKNLQALDLSSNSLTGPIPESLGQLKNLLSLHLLSNSLAGPIPESLGQLKNLQSLDLSSNSLTGPIPESLGQLKNLQSLDLSSNSLTGLIPESLGQLKSLQSLDLSSNSLTGPIPENLGQLSQLNILDFGSNSLQGVVSDAHFAKMTQLEYLRFTEVNGLIFNMSSKWVPPFQLFDIDLRSNSLGPRFPSWLQTQKVFEYLDISNTGIKDVIPKWLWKISSGALYINISVNQISGEVSTSLQSLSASLIDMSSNRFGGKLPYLNSTIEYLYLKENQFSGDLDPILNSEMSNLDIVVLSGNNLSGNIPPNLCHLHMRYLDLSHNKLFGEIPDCQNYSSLSLVVLNLASNYLVGTTPQWICPPQSSLKELHLEDNQFSGDIPHFMKYCTGLEILDIGANKLTGNIPSWIGESLSSLKFLRLCSNRLSGTIPSQLSFLSNLQVLDISQNHLSGDIPKSFKNFTAMIKKKTLGSIIANGILPKLRNSSFFQDNPPIVEMLNVVMKGRLVEYTSILSLLMTLDLSGNNFSGEIPMELTNLVGLVSLNLSGNQLKGNIPDNFAGMELESLDLSRNKLSGAIPSSIALLTSLSYLNLSYNNLSGHIPSGPQLQTLLNPSIYEGNPGLCGPPLRKACDVEESQSKKGGENDNNDSDMFGLYLGMGLGYVIGLWGVFGVLVFKNSWRTAYFLFFDDMNDRIYVAKETLKWRTLSILLG